MKNKWWLYIGLGLLLLFVRLYRIGSVPPSLYWDQVSLGYDAYSIARTAHDLHGHFLPLVAFASYGDWKPAGYFYLIVPFIWLFGLSNFVVTLPSIIAGMAIVIGTGYLARKTGTSVVAAIFVASISPWALQFSRSAWEANVATACIVWAVYFGLNAIEEKKLNLTAALKSLFLFIFSMYTYHSAKIDAPAILLGLVLFHSYTIFQQTTKSNSLFNWIQNNSKKLIALVIFGVVLIFPLAKDILSPQNTHRFQETNIFSDISVIEKSNALKAAEDNSFWARIFYHRYLFFSWEILQNYFSHFSLQFLFISGDANPRHSIQLYGELYHIELLYLLIGIFVWLRKRTDKHLLLLWWLAISILPAAITTGSPHALRILPAMPVFLLLVATGLEAVINWLIEMLHTYFPKQKRNTLIYYLPIVAVLLIYIAEFLPYWNFYQYVYPIVYASEWQYGYKEVMQSVAAYKQGHSDTPIYITREQGRPAMYYWYENKVDPKLVQQAESSAKKDQGEFLNFDTITFITNEGEILSSNGLVVSSPDYLQSLSQKFSFTEVKSIDNLDKKTVWVLAGFQKK